MTMRVSFQRHDSSYLLVYLIENTKFLEANSKPTSPKGSSIRVLLFLPNMIVNIGQNHSLKCKIILKTFTVEFYPFAKIDNFPITTNYYVFCHGQTTQKHAVERFTFDLMSEAILLKQRVPNMRITF